MDIGMVEDRISKKAQNQERDAIQSVSYSAWL